ncbi:alpha-galactosidase [Mucilaginibacter rubeus]|uniref:Alpha-galactosidase n=1 Tax=Mucilaginibacter rubeus TaxID=2027860 RepID=A0A5C1I0L2_9SPHI|nr:alpha-galactosidase [Mucilaginibacter rubeus]QEM11707.1 alpha-galactosidase [Mucilaginibacter rubeus]
MNKKRPYPDRLAVCLLFLFLTGAFVLIAGEARAQYSEKIRISTRDNLLLIGVKDNKLQQIRYGRNISEQDIHNLPSMEPAELYPVFGVNVSTAGLRMTHADGNPTTALVYQNYSVEKADSNTVITRIKMKDSYYPVEVTLCFKAYIAENIIAQWVEIRHHEKGAVTLFDMASSNLSFDRSSYFLTYFNGDWSNEFNHYENLLEPGILTLDSKEGIRTDQKTNPSFLLSLDRRLEENSGEVLGASLAWPGNWQIQFNVDNNHKLRIIPGINPYASAYQLPAGQLFQTPSFLYTFSQNGAGEVTRRFHRWARKYGMQHGAGDRDVVLNNWETTGFDFDEKGLHDLIRQAGELGFDLFLLDDGWFGNKYPRNNDQAGLGDWQVNRKKLPHGLNDLVRQSADNKVKFGLWVEPEMINPKSELYEKHPEWVLTAPNRSPDLQRNQFILDLSNPAVQDFVVSSLSSILDQTKGLNYLKWDCNRFLSNAWSNYLGKEKQANLYVDYTRGYLSVLQRIRAKYPELTLMLCASGGGRMDYGSMPFYDEYWPSDNSNAHDRVLIQWGMSYFFPAIGFAAHVSEMGQKTSLKFRLDVAMAGKLGMDMQPDHLNGEEKAFLKDAIKAYKQVSHIVYYGDQYRLLSPYSCDRAALMYVSQDKKEALLFSYQVKKGSGADYSTIYLNGLDPNASYKLTEVNKGSYSRVEAYEGKVFTGKYLMEEGIRFAMWNVDESSVMLLQQIQ